MSHFNPKQKASLILISFLLVSCFACLLSGGLETYAAPENFTIIALPDTQFYSSTYPAIFNNQTSWIVNNVEALNIVFVTHEGDLVNTYRSTTEWQRANTSMSKLDNSVPWAVLPGNHDGVSSGQTTVNYNTYFGYNRFNGKSWYGGAYQNINTNNYELFTAAGDQFIIFHLQYAPSDSVLNWANNIISSYPNRRAIVTTHNYLIATGARSSVGQNIWTKFIKPHANQIFLVLCGHARGEAQRTDTVNGHKVYQVLADYQRRPNGGNGWLRILEFQPAISKILVETYSPYLNRYEKDSNSQFTLSYDMSYPTSPILLGVASNVPSSRTASIQPTQLTPLTTYFWYIVATDKYGAETMSAIWKFTKKAQTCTPTQKEPLLYVLA